MPTHSGQNSKQSMDRRRVLKTIGVASSAALAGCTGGGSDAEDLGERVPSLTFQYWSDQGPPTVLFEETISNIQSVSTDMGIQIETMPMTTAEGLNAVANDNRDFHVGVNSHGPSPGRLDPDELLNAYSISFAGANGRYNPTNYASCEFSEFVQQQSTASPGEREAIVGDAMSVFSEDIAFIPTIERPFTAAVNTDQLTGLDPGEAGLSDIHWSTLLESELEAHDGEGPIIANLPSEMLTSSFYPTVADGDAMVLYTNLTTSPLLMYDSNYELIPVLAESWETNEDGTQTTFQLRDATFHNGDPVTPEDVKWTYEFLRDQYHNGDYQWTNLPESLTVEIIDDSTVAFNTDEPAPQLLTARLAIYGVLPEDPYVEAGIEENPTNFEDPMIGAGPYQKASYSNQRSMSLEPHDGHPVWSPETPILTQIYESVDGVVRAFENEELNLAVALHPEGGQQLKDSMGDSVQVITGVAHLPYGIMPQISYAPCMFPEFRQALSHMIDRQSLNAIYAFGESQPVLHSTFNSQAHPWYNEEVLTQIAGETSDVDQARQVLEDAGWGWDNNDNLHYPQDASMEAWPQGEEPSSNDFPCLE